MVKISNDNGIKLLPYFDATELCVNGKIFKDNGKKWAAKSRGGKIYSGFISIYLPFAYPPQFDFATKIMCGKSGWKNYLVEQAEYLLNNFEIGGIYMDRVDYRLECHDHLRNKDHFTNGIFDIVHDITKTVKKYNKNFITVMNDSCMIPDETMGNCIKTVDYVLSELLPIDWNPNAIPNRLLNEFGDLIWKLRHLLRPLVLIITENQFKSESMTDLRRIYNIVKRLNKYKKRENIILFSHRKDIEGFKAIKSITEKTGTKIVYFTGIKPLISLKKAT